MILRCDWIYPVTAPPIRDGFVEVCDDRIVRVGPASELDSAAPDVERLDGCALLPGLVNAHTHLELGCYAGRIPPGPFWDWLSQLVTLRRGPGQVEREQQAADEWGRRSLRAGVTCVGDISRRNITWPVLKQLSIRKVCFVELLSLADHPPRNPDELRAGVEAVDEDALLTVGISPHTPYTVHAEHIRAAIELAVEVDRPWTMHLAETREEVAFLRGDATAFPPMLASLLQRHELKSPCSTPTELLSACGGDRRAGSLAHVNYVDDREIERLAATGHVAIYCPRAHRFFGHEPHPLPRLRAAGVPVAIGTDSPASNDGLSMLAELHSVMETVADSPSPTELLEMATLTAARAIGLGEQIGSLESGKQADLVAFPVDPGAADPVRTIIQTEPAPARVYVAGRCVIRDGREC